MRPRMGLVPRFCSKNGHTLCGVLSQALHAETGALGTGSQEGGFGLGRYGFEAVATYFQAVQPVQGPPCPL